MRLKMKYEIKMRNTNGMNGVKVVYLSALSERTRTRSSHSNVVLPTGVVTNEDDLDRVMKALDHSTSSNKD